MIKLENFSMEYNLYFIGKTILFGHERGTIGDVLSHPDNYGFDYDIIKDIYFKEHNPEEDLSLLTNHEDWIVRREVVRQGASLDVLIEDELAYVRVAVAEQGYGLDTLIKDQSDLVRIAVAEQGYGLATLINDESPYVRIAVAGQGYGLDILINDKDAHVRAAVAKQGFRLQKLLSDDSIDVFHTALSVLRAKYIEK